MSVELRQSQNNTRLRQYQALLEVAESTAAHRDLSSLLRDLAARLQLVVKFDGVNVVLYDAEHKLMRMNVLESPSSAPYSPVPRRSSCRMGMANPTAAIDD